MQLSPGHPSIMAFTTPPFPSFTSGSSGPYPSLENAAVFMQSRRRRVPAFTIPFFGSKRQTVRFSSVQVYGKRKLPQHVIDEHFNSLIGKKVLLEEVKQAVEAVNKWFDENEYVCSRLFLGPIPVVMNALDLYSLEPLLTDLKLVPVDADGKDNPEGSIKTRKGTICNAIGMNIGDVFIWKSSGFARLMALGLFNYANAEVKVLSNESVQLTLRLCERSPGRLEPGAGISSDGKVYGDVSIVDNNFMGRGQRLRVEWQKRFDVPRPSGGIAFEDMRIGARIPLSFRLRAYRDSNSTRSLPSRPNASGSGSGSDESDRVGTNADIMDRESPLRYEKDRDGILMDFGYRAPGSFLLFNFTPMLEHIHPNAIDINGTSSLQAVLQSAVTHATRRMVDCPRAGHMFRVEQYLGTPLRTAADPFYKVILRAGQYFGLPSMASIVTGGVIGLGSENLPWHEQRSLGGQPTVRGYTYGELGRHRTFATTRLELRVPISFSRFKGSDKDAVSGNRDGKRPENDVLSTKTEAPGDAPASTGSTGNDSDSYGSPANMISLNGEHKMPPLVGVVFTDAAAAGFREPQFLGASFGLGIRVGGIISVEWACAGDGGRSRLHFGLVDRNM